MTLPVDIVRDSSGERISLLLAVPVLPAPAPEKPFGIDIEDVIPLLPNGSLASVLDRLLPGSSSPRPRPTLTPAPRLEGEKARRRLPRLVVLPPLACTVCSGGGEVEEEEEEECKRR